MEDIILNSIVPEYVSPNRDGLSFFLENEFKTNLETHNEIMAYLRKISLDILKFNKNVNVKPFTKIFHKIWLTDETNPQKIPIEIIEHFILQLKEFDNDKTVQQYLWTNTPHIFTNLCGDYSNLNVVDVKEFIGSNGYKIFDSFMSEKIYAKASSILRLIIIEKYGGIYSDMGWGLKKNILDLVKNFDFVANGEFFNPGAVTHNIIGSRLPHFHLITNLLKKFVDKNFLQKYYRLCGENFACEILNPELIAASVSAECGDDLVLLVVNGPMVSSRLHLNSWQTKYEKCNKTQMVNKIIN